MRGIAYLLFLARKHGATRVLYHDATSIDTVMRNKMFPTRMTDIIALDGIAFEEHPLPFPAGVRTYVHVSEAGNPLKRLGFKDMGRVRPKNEAVVARVAELAAFRPYLAFHVRGAGMTRSRLPQEEAILGSLERLGAGADAHQTRRIYLEVIDSRVRFDPANWRQTSDVDMMIDFFAMAGAAQVIRLIPSEFSRFAAWVGGKRLRYLELS
jgi:hypothetical protein